ncbi:hypothetical protein [Phycicoccus sp. HDW14]|uniref:hypothetical protein n=1 Tax=Phycicoccus sp. HDW14 TaxID=2714941 RepID=UPI0035302906
MGFDYEQCNERSALTLLALLHLKPMDSWADASNPMLGTRAIMDWIRDEHDVDYAANTRETIRRFTLHQFAEALLVVQNPDQPDRPVNSPKWNYQVTSEALVVIRAYGTTAYAKMLAEYLTAAPGLRRQYAAARQVNRIPISLPGGNPLASPLVDRTF